MIQVTRENEYRARYPNKQHSYTSHQTSIAMYFKNESRLSAVGFHRRVLFNIVYLIDHIRSDVRNPFLSFTVGGIVSVYEITVCSVDNESSQAIRCFYWIPITVSTA